MDDAVVTRIAEHSALRRRLDDERSRQHRRAAHQTSSYAVNLSIRSMPPRTVLVRPTSRRIEDRDYRFQVTSAPAFWEHTQFERVPS
jgi:hypothetical protein